MILKNYIIVFNGPTAYRFEAESMPDVRGASHITLSSHTNIYSLELKKQMIRIHLTLSRKKGETKDNHQGPRMKTSLQKLKEVVFIPSCDFSSCFYASLDSGSLFEKV